LRWEDDHTTLVHPSVRTISWTLIVPLLLATGRAAPAGESSAPGAAEDAQSAESDRPSKAWSASASVFIYVVPDSRTYAQPTVAVDYRNVHVEGRFNYEAIDAGSLWLGYDFAVGDSLTVAFTPMIGGVFGHVTGVAPGYELTLNYWKLELYSEGEYFFDTADSSGDFTYTWSELSLAPIEWVRVGVAAQRTRAYHTDVDTQWGPLFGASYRWLGVTTYVFDLDQTRQTVVVGLQASF